MLVGHQKQWQYLRKMVEMGILPHAFLFSGEEQLGKKTVALELMKLLFCDSKSVKAASCGECRACRDISKNLHPDVVMIEPQDKEIKIGQIRKLENSFCWRPALGTWKAAVIDSAHLMTKEAQSALLKTLEEPRGNAIMVLVSSRPELLLTTIRSRTQQLKFFQVAETEIEAGLKKLGVQAENIKKFSIIARGRPGEAIGFISNAQAIKQYQKKEQEFKALLQADLSFRFGYAKTAAENLGELHYNIGLWLRIAREMLLGNMSQQDGSAPRRLVKLIGNLQSFDLLLSQTNINPRLALELIFLEL